MAIRAEEDVVFIGTSTGDVLALDAATLEIRASLRCNQGAVYGIAVNRSGDLVATLGKDKRVALLSWNGIMLRKVGIFDTRSMRPWNDTDPLEDGDSDSHAIAFHPTVDRFAARASSGGLVEVDFTREGAFTPIHCTRFHGFMDLNSLIYAGDDVYSGGQHGLVVLSRGTEVLYNWQLDQRAAHWFCFGPGDQLFVSCDSGAIGEINMHRSEWYRRGPVFANDDLECVDYNPVTGMLYACSFDRNLYSVDPATLMVKGVAFQARFKLKYCYALRSAPHEVLLVVRDGSVQRVDAQKGVLIREFRETAFAQWSIVPIEPGRFLVGGESDEVHLMEYRFERDFDGKPHYSVESYPLHMEPSYSKRLAWHEPSRSCLFARADGRIYRWALGSAAAEEILRLDDAVRDLAVEPLNPIAYACTEGGALCKFNLETGTTLRMHQHPYERPIWALAYNALRDVVAIGERGGDIVLLDAQTFSRVATGPAASRVKRMKWISATQMMMSCSKWVEIVDWEAGEHRVLTDEIANTIEDFVYDPATKYAVIISYTGEIAVLDTEHAKLIAKIPLDIDVAKGIEWAYDPLQRGSKPLDVLVVGRIGRPLVFRVFNDTLYALGPAHEPVVPAAA
jgi:WD40 repeat protein